MPPPKKKKKKKKKKWVMVPQISYTDMKDSNPWYLYINGRSIQI